MRPFLLAGDLADLETAVSSIRPDGRTALYDGLMDGLDHLAQGSRARKVLVVISDGGDNASDAKLETRARARARVERRDLHDRHLRRGRHGQEPRRAEVAGADDRRRALSAALAGELLTACERIAREIRGGYTIGYVPPARDGAYHRVRSRSIRPSARKLNVRTRPGYFAAGRAAQP